MDETNVCLFSNILDTCTIDKKFATQPLTETRVAKIQSSSKERGDNFELDSLDDNRLYHSDCYTYYISKQKIQRYLDNKKKSRDQHDGAVHWPKDGMVSDLLKSIEYYIAKFDNSARATLAMKMVTRQKPQQPLKGRTAGNFKLF